MPFVVPALVFVVTTFFLVKSADIFIENAVKFGQSLKWPSFLTGVLIVAIGTSLPELATGIVSLIKVDPVSPLVGDMTIGNVLGSNIANVFLGLGIVVVVAGKSIKFKQNIFHVHFPVLMIATISMIFMLTDKVIYPWEGMIFFGIMASYLWFLFVDHKKSITEKLHHVPFKWKYIWFILIGLTGVIIASNFAIGAILSIGNLLIEIMGYDEVVNTALSATLVAIGTSLPEMVVVYTAVKKNQAEMAIGNILGSNIFNIVLILGVSSMIRTLHVSDFNYYLNLPFAVASFFVYWSVSKDQNISRQEALAMTFLYVLYVIQLIGWIASSGAKA